ncbi:unnamed protein product [Danaus chrysippus]|uniref:(African queen) hypothetical protein n=1 Tax=Danaus chrysippus TaxID=151541 RepID=A0A8J2QHU7_9NEOP|nr:unnamed protein product [Danaus chrysippus]
MGISKLQYLLQSVLWLVCLQSCLGAHFASHVSVNTPGHSYSHGVGNPVSVLQRFPTRRTRRPAQQQPGYPRQKPRIPFEVEDLPPHRGHGNGNNNRWNNNVLGAYDTNTQAIPLLPPSPYKVDSPDPESLWPVGLFIPPITPLHYSPLKRSDTAKTAEIDKEDPYLIQGSEAVAASLRAPRGPYFHEIPHIKSLLANQQLRIKNNLTPNRLASIRKTWPYNRA